jgi:pSer/pThr/pTyr-binding forkhead associated (FHA) protein
MTIRVRIIGDSGQRRDVEVMGNSLVIGRDPECDLVLDSIFVSRSHARLCRIQDGYEIIDLESRNGVDLNGQQIDRSASLIPGDTVTIGPFELQVLERPLFEQVTQNFNRHRDLPALIVDRATHEVLINGTPVKPPLSRLEFRLLTLLHDADGSVCERDQLGDAIWGSNQWDLNMLHRLVHRLKEKIESRTDQPQFIVTVTGVGYRLQVN